MLRATLNRRDGGLEISRGTKFQINYISKSGGQRKIAPISVGPEPNLYFALFDEDDVDFEVVVDNTGSKLRDVAFDLTVHKKRDRFQLPKNSSDVLQTIESHGKKFHFFRQNSEDGLALISEAATRYGLSFEEASRMIGQMKFSVQYSKISRVYQIFVKTVAGNTIAVNAHPLWKIEKLKQFIMDREGIPVDEQVLVFRGRLLLNDDQVLQADCGIEHASTVHLMMRLPGGLDLNNNNNNNNHNNSNNNNNSQQQQQQQPSCQSRSPNSCTDRQCKTHSAAHRWHQRLKTWSTSERGVICLGGQCGQQFEPAEFDPDGSIEVENFVIEMRMASRYCLVNLNMM